MTDDTLLLAALAGIRERGAIGEASLEAAVAHAEQFVAQVPASALRLVDLGSGGGLPGLVIAARRTDLEVVLVERRTQRADLLRRAVRALGVDRQVTVHGADVRSIAAQETGAFDVVTARSFAAPEITVHWASVLLRSGGVLIVSEPPEDDVARWPASLLDRVGMVDQGRQQGVRCFTRR